MPDVDAAESALTKRLEQAEAQLGGARGGVAVRRDYEGLRLEILRIMAPYIDLHEGETAPLEKVFQWVKNGKSD